MSAKLVQVGGATVDLPWLPTSHELGGWAPEYSETARPGMAPLSTRSGDPLSTQRIEFTIRSADIRSSVSALVSQVRALAKAKPLIRLVIGSHDYGAWQITDAGASITDYAPDGSPARAEVMIDMREASGAVIRIGPLSNARSNGKGKR